MQVVLNKVFSPKPFKKNWCRFVLLFRDIPDSKFAGYRISGQNWKPDIRYPTDSGYPVRY